MLVQIKAESTGILVCTCAHTCVCVSMMHVCIMPDDGRNAEQVPEEVKERRRDEIMSLIQDAQDKYSQSLVGKEMEVGALCFAVRMCVAVIHGIYIIYVVCVCLPCSPRRAWGVR